MTKGNLKEMNEAEQQDLARRLWEGSEVFDYDTALELVRSRPERARDLLRMRAEMKRELEESKRADERRKRALIEDYG
jgi:hypothetical protein